MVPSPLDPFDPEAWWRTERERRLVRNEYGKYLLWRVSGESSAQEDEPVPGRHDE